MDNNKVALRSTDPWGSPLVAGRLNNMFSQFNDVMDSLWNNLDVSVFADIQPKGKFPKVNVSESDKDFIVNIAVAGYDKEDVKLELKENCLFIKADKAESNEESTNKILMQEISRRSFRRAIQFPVKVDPEKISAGHENGVITLTIGKKIAEGNEPVEIKIN